MTAEVMTSRNQRKFIPILRAGNWSEAAASWLAGKYHVDLRAVPYSESQFDDLLTTLHGTRPQAPPVGKPSLQPETPSVTTIVTETIFEPIRITGVVVDEVGTPRDDGSRGSALYVVPFQLSRQPPIEWAQLFVACWNNPPEWTAMHRPGIASVRDNKIILNGTTVEEIQRHHRKTLLLALNEANKKFSELHEKRRSAEEEKRQRFEEHRKNVTEATKRLKFDS